MLFLFEKAYPEKACLNVRFGVHLLVQMIKERNIDMPARDLQTLSIVEARERLTQLPEEFEQIVRDGEGTPAVKVTRWNKPVLAILPWELYEAIMETLEVLSDDEQMLSLRQAFQEVAESQGKPWKTVKKELGWDESRVSSGS